jgi:hypothetical protein
VQLCIKITLLLNKYCLITVEDFLDGFVMYVRSATNIFVLLRMLILHPNRKL